ncbi:[FeFe] hydrogenase H-cluster radical SAM maturase HydE [uncultured Desulfosarcina sp.]|uniref:[FeFe] hydrogenase H-cluster radical SAM maturase HydE n=1 Tax=uncultured Desulfosarcina sp. TaxID=218289 RepID=UPI0029C672AD|nr:[FeFe] hydrogenase H-cluster radical SAM maturase HydE [uncultured Desulfosarcina sp.]
MRSPIQTSGKSKTNFTTAKIRSLLESTGRKEIEALRQEAHWATLLHCGNRVYFRGIIEFSNICTCDCYYCGIRRSNKDVVRYQLAKTQILRQAKWCAERGFGSVVLQSGERRDARFVDFVTDVVRTVKNETRCSLLPDGLGITLCVGEQSREVYARFFEAGAHRYLLRIETASPSLFRRWHPPEQTFENRRRCLSHLRSIGYQVGTGVMIGAPWQTTADLAEDVAFFKEMDVDMIGMGPYIPHHAAPLAKVDVAPPAMRLQRALSTIAVVRLVLRDVNIAATTALQTLSPLGRERGLDFGANVIMPQVTSPECRKQYTLYDAKPCDNETDPGFQSALEKRIRNLGREVGRNRWGDSPHAWIRQAFIQGAA